MNKNQTKTRKRELDALTECAEELKCDKLTVVTYNQEETIEQNGYTRHLLPITKFCSLTVQRSLDGHFC